MKTFDKHANLVISGNLCEKGIAVEFMYAGKKRMGVVDNVDVHGLILKHEDGTFKRFNRFRVTNFRQVSGQLS